MPVEIFARPWPSRFRLHANVRFRGGAAQVGFSHAHNFSRSRTLCRISSAPNSRRRFARALVRLAAVRQNAEERHARALRGKRVVDVVAEVERFAARRAVEQQAQTFRVRLPFFHVVHGDGAAKNIVRVRALQRVAQFPARAAGEERKFGAARPALQALVRDQPAFPRHISRAATSCPNRISGSALSLLRTEPPGPSDAIQSVVKSPVIVVAGAILPLVNFGVGDALAS